MTALTDLMQSLNDGSEDRRFYGVCVGIVTDNEDPEQLGRVKLKLPAISEEYATSWARVVTPMAGSEKGLFFLPQRDDEVLVAFEFGSIDRPYVLGSLWNGVDKAPLKNGDDNHNDIRMIKSRSGHTIKLNDKDNAETIEIIDGSSKNKIVFDTQANTITITADKDIKLQATNGKIILQAQGIEINSDLEIKVEAQQNLNIKAGPNLKLQAGIIDIN